MWGPVIALILVEILTTKKNENIIHLGLRYAANQLLFYTQQPTKNRQTLWRRVRRGGASIGEHVQACHSINLGGDSDNEKNANIYYTLALDGRRSIILHTTTNQKQAHMVYESRKRRRNHQATVLVAILLTRGGSIIKTKIKLWNYKLLFFSADD